MLIEFKLTKEMFINSVSGYINKNGDCFPIKVTEKAWEEFNKKQPIKVSFTFEHKKPG